MKKLLLCTTALVGLVAGSASASAPEDIKVSVGGSTKFVGAHAKQDADHKGSFSFSPNQKSTAFLTKSKASLKAEGKADDLTYGAVLRLRMVANSSDGMGDTRSDRSHIYLDTMAGSVHLGSNFSASKMMQVDASNVASATGGIDGDFSDFAGTSVVKSNYISDGSDADTAKSTAFGNLSITGVDTLANRYDDGESSRKIGYMSPRIEGVQFGFSFAPDVRNTGVAKDERDLSKTYLAQEVMVKNLVSVGLGYENTINDVKVQLALVGDKGKASKQYGTGKYQDNFNDLQTYSVGGVISTNGFSFALSYHNDGKSLTRKTGTDGNALPKFKSDWYTVGLGYEDGKMSTSLTYLTGSKKWDATNTELATNVKVKSQIVSLGVDYEVAPGLKPFAEVTMATYKPESEGTYKSKNKSTVFMLGTKLKF
jgi:hypothetical protein